MKTVKMQDITLRAMARQRDAALSFKERIEIARTLDRLRMDVIELPVIEDSVADALLNKTVAGVVGFSALSATVGETEDSVTDAWESIRTAKNPGLQVRMPVSAIQMEYQCHKKGPKMIEAIKALVGKARYYTENVEFSAEDATRAEKPFLYEAITAAIEAGANQVTLCDTAGVMTPTEWTAFLKETAENVPALSKVTVGVEISDMLKMSVASAAAAVDAGAAVVKVSIAGCDCPSTVDFAAFVGVRGQEMGLAIHTRTTELTRAARQMQWMLNAEKEDAAGDTAAHDIAGLCLTAGDSITEVNKVVRQLGYDLTEEDSAKVYEAFKTVAEKKNFVGVREMDAIIATAALQVPSTYTIKDYVITAGGSIGSLANVTLEKDGHVYSGVSAGDGPIDAAFLAIEQIIGHHYELDDFQIQSVTEGREAMGSALVKLRSSGRLYSGSGISTDIIGASIRAYISALNKIVYEEA